MLPGTGGFDFGSRSAPFEGAAIVIPPALPADTYLAASALHKTGSAYPPPVPGNSIIGSKREFFHVQSSQRTGRVLYNQSVAVSWNQSLFRRGPTALPFCAKWANASQCIGRCGCQQSAVNHRFGKYPSLQRSYAKRSPLLLITAMVFSCQVSQREILALTGKR